MQYTRNGFLYPEGTDLVRDGYNIIEQLCRALDPEPVPLVITPSTGWNIVSVSGVSTGLVTQIGPFVYWKIEMERTGAAITTDATGNIVTDIQVFSGMIDPYKPYRMTTAGAQPTSAPVTCVKSANHNLFGYVDHNGGCWLTHGFPGQTYAAGTGYRFTAFYLLNF